MTRLENLLKLLEENASDAFMQHALGLEYIKLNNDEKAATVFENLLAAQPDYVGSYYHLAKIYERMNNEPEAIAVYERGMEVAKRLGDTHAFLELKSAHEFLNF